MEVELSENTLRLIKKIVRDEMRRAINDVDDWVPTEQAAKILGITPRYLRRIKDRYPWKQDIEGGRLLFKRSSLLT